MTYSFPNHAELSFWDRLKSGVAAQGCDRRSGSAFSFDAEPSPDSSASTLPASPDTVCAYARSLLHLHEPVITFNGPVANSSMRITPMTFDVARREYAA